MQFICYTNIKNYGVMQYIDFRKKCEYCYFAEQTDLESTEDIQTENYQYKVDYYIPAFCLCQEVRGIDNISSNE